MIPANHCCSWVSSHCGVCCKSKLDCTGGFPFDEFGVGSEAKRF
jgi:hypothetical protein